MDLSHAEQINLDLAELRALSGRNAKEAVVKKKWKSAAHHEFLDLVGNTHRQWYTTWGSVLETHVASGHDLELDEVLYAAENRLATPNETNSRLRAKLDEGWPEEVLRAVINKTLDAGITVASAKKALGTQPRTFKPALAADWCKMSDEIRRKTLRNGRYVSTPKMDGLRCLFFLNMPNEGVFSRGLKPLKNLDGHLAALKTVFTEPCIIDGEALSASNRWEDSMSGAKRSGAKVAMHFYPFDYLPGDEIAANKYQMTSEERYDHLTRGVDLLSEDLFRIVIRSQVLKTPEDVMTEHALCCKEGWEGAVLHELDSPYACKRSRAWLKIKSWLSDNFMCVGFFKGTGKHKHRLGGIRVKGFYQGQVEITSEVGTGFSDRQREDIWANQQKYLNKVAEVKFFEITPDKALRFPSFLRWVD